MTGFSSPVAPGTGWPEDPADAATPVAADPADVRKLAAEAKTLAELDARVSVCRACPRLVEWREQVAVEKRKSFQDEPYWGRPVAGWGSDHPSILIAGLAPAAHGGNRTGRVFTGDRSGDWLFAALHRAGIAAIPTSIYAGDGQRMDIARMAAAVRCAPPENKPTTAERDACRPWFSREFELVLPTLKVVLALGQFAWNNVIATLEELGGSAGRPRPRFGHGVQARIELAHIGTSVDLVGCYHPSQQNTFTGKLTEGMLDEVLVKVLTSAGERPVPAGPAG